MGFNVIVDPDFVDHWKTRMLVAMLGDDEVAPVYVIRLWAHCQNRRMWIFDLPSAALKGICRFAGEAVKFEEAMTACGFVARNGNELTVVGWDEYNATLIAAWANGGKGGRPRKVKDEDPEKTHGLPTGNPSDNPQETHGQTDKRGLDVRGEDKSKSKPASRAKSKNTPMPEGFCVSQRVIDWAAKEGFDRLDEHFKSFVSKAEAKGYTYANWDSALINAIRDDWAKINDKPKGNKTAGLVL